MRIAEVETFVLGTPWRELTYVHVLTDEGVDGIGEARMFNRTDALLGYLAEVTPRHVIGADPFEIEQLVRRLWHDDYVWPGEVAMSGLAALELACWDIVGKALGQPLHRLLGGALRQRIKAYANGWYRVDRTPAEFHRAARAAVAKGYRALKLDPFGAAYRELDRASLAHAVGLVEAVREATGPDVDLLIEMHGRFTPAQAIRVVRALEPYEPGWFEEPVGPGNARSLATVAAATDVPIATGERLYTRHGFRELLELGAVAVVQPDITNCGGILEARKLAAWAEVYDVQVAPHNVGGPVSTAAALQLAAVTPNFSLQEFFNDFADAHVMQAAPGAPRPVDGYFELPTAPGLGVSFDRDFVAAHPRQALQFNLYEEDWQLRDKRA